MVQGSKLSNEVFTAIESVVSNLINANVFIIVDELNSKNFVEKMKPLMDYCSDAYYITRYISIDRFVEYDSVSNLQNLILDTSKQQLKLIFHIYSTLKKGNSDIVDNTENGKKHKYVIMNITKMLKGFITYLEMVKDMNEKSVLKQLFHSGS